MLKKVFDCLNAVEVGVWADAVEACDPLVDRAVITRVRIEAPKLESTIK